MLWTSETSEPDESLIRPKNREIHPGPIVNKIIMSFAFHEFTLSFYLPNLF